MTCGSPGRASRWGSRSVFWAWAGRSRKPAGRSCAASAGRCARCLHPAAEVSACYKSAVAAAAVAVEPSGDVADISAASGDCRGSACTGATASSRL